MGGETSRHPGRFRTVFYDIKVDFCCSAFDFCGDASFGLCHADVRFVLYFTHQDAPVYLAGLADFGYVGVLRLVPEVGLAEIRLAGFVMFISVRTFALWLRGR